MAVTTAILHTYVMCVPKGWVRIGVGAQLPTSFLLHSPSVTFWNLWVVLKVAPAARALPLVVKPISASVLSLTPTAALCIEHQHLIPFVGDWCSIVVTGLASIHAHSSLAFVV